MANDFTKEMAAITNDITKGVDIAIKASGLYGWNLITASTPVDTGRLRGSWLLSVDKIESDTLKKVKPKRTAGGAKYAIYSNPLPPKVPRFSVVRNLHFYISNSVEYVAHIEFGTEKIAAFAMVTKATPKINSFLNRQLKKVDNKVYK